MGLTRLRAGRRRFLVTASIALPLLALAAVLPAGAQTGISASIDVRPAQVVVGGDLYAEIRLRGADPSRTRIVPPVFDGLLPTGDPELREGPDGLIVTYRLRAARHGEQMLGGFLVRTPEGSVSTAPVRITVLRRAAAAAAEPVLRWRLATTRPFVWQAVTAMLELTATAPLPLVGRPEVAPVAALDLQPLPVQRGIEPLTEPDRYVIPVARYRLTARAAGRLTLPPARVLVDGVERVSDSMGLVIHPLPESIAASRAVGDFARRVEIRRIGTGAFELTVELAGAGGVSFVEHPPPVVSAGTIVATVAQVDAAGARKAWRYRLRSDASGALSVVVPPLPYLRLPDGETAQIDAETVTAPQAQGAATPGEALPVIDPAERGCGAAGPLDRRRVCRAALLHNRGVSRFAAGDVSTAVLALRASLRMRGWPETRAALAGIEEATGLTGLAGGADTTPLRRVLWVVGCVIAVGTAAAALWRGRSRRGRAVTVAAGAAAVALVVAVGAVAAPGGEDERRMAVIGRAGAAVQRIPAPDGTTVGRLPAGSPVRVLHRFDDYALIDTATAGLGWVSTGAVATAGDQRSR